MIQLTPHMRFLVCTHPVDFCKGIDGLAALCCQRLSTDPIAIAHPSLHRGAECPACAHGTIHAMASPAQLTRIFGQAPLVAVV